MSEVETDRVTLVLDSATARAVCGVVRGARELASASAEGGHAAQRALVLVDDVLARAGCGRTASRRSSSAAAGVVHRLRIGIATARGLALALDVPCAGVDPGRAGCRRPVPWH